MPISHSRAAIEEAMIHSLSQLCLCKNRDMKAGSRSFRFYIRLLVAHEEEVIRAQTTEIVLV